MTRITNVEELQEEKQRLNRELQIQKAILDNEIRLMREQLAPIRKALSTIGILHDSDNGTTILKAGANIGMALLGRKLLYGAGWVMRFLFPILASSLSSKLLHRIRGKG